MKPISDFSRADIKALLGFWQAMIGQIQTMPDHLRARAHDAILLGKMQQDIDACEKALLALDRQQMNIWASAKFVYPLIAARWGLSSEEVAALPNASLKLLDILSVYQKRIGWKLTELPNLPVFNLSRPDFFACWDEAALILSVPFSARQREDAYMAGHGFISPLVQIYRAEKLSSN